MKDKYKEYFGIERPSEMYENSERIEWIVSETDATRLNTRPGKDTVQVGEKETQLPPLETKEKAWERLVKLDAQQIFENLQIRWMEFPDNKNPEVIQDKLTGINKFIKEAENLNRIEALEKPEFRCRKQEYLRIKHKYYDKNFCGTKDGWSIIGRTPIDLIIAGVYAEYFLFKNWLEQRLKEQIDNNEPTQSPANSRSTEPEPATPQPILDTKKVKLPTGLEHLFEHISKYKKVMEILVSRSLVEPTTYIWKDESKGNKAYLAAFIKDLHAKGFYKNNTRPTNEQIRQICKTSFGWDVGIDTVKHTKASDFDFTFIPMASIIE